MLLVQMKQAKKAEDDLAAGAAQDAFVQAQLRAADSVTQKQAAGAASTLVRQEADLMQTFAERTQAACETLQSNAQELFQQGRTADATQLLASVADMQDKSAAVLTVAVDRRALSVRFAKVRYTMDAQVV